MNSAPTRANVEYFCTSLFSAYLGLSPVCVAFSLQFFLLVLHVSQRWFVGYFYWTWLWWLWYGLSKGEVRVSSPLGSISNGLGWCSPLPASGGGGLPCVAVTKFKWPDHYIWSLWNCFCFHLNFSLKYLIFCLSILNKWRKVQLRSVYSLPRRHGNLFHLFTSLETWLIFSKEVFHTVFGSSFFLRLSLL